MFLAMNRFKITPGFEAGFEKIWRERDSHLSSVPGFKKFSLLKVPLPTNMSCMLLILSGKAKRPLWHGPNQTLLERLMPKLMLRRVLTLVILSSKHSRQF